MSYEEAKGFANRIVNLKSYDDYFASDSDTDVNVVTELLRNNPSEVIEWLISTLEEVEL